METVYFPTEFFLDPKMFETAMSRRLISKIKDLVIPQDMLEAIKSGNRKIKIRFKNLEAGTYDVVNYSENFD